MSLVTSFAVGVIVGVVVTFFIARNNTAKAIEVISKTQEKEEA